TSELGITAESLSGVVFEDWDLLITLVQKLEIAQSEACFNLSPHSLRGFACAHAFVFALSVVVHVYVPLRAAFFDLYAHQFVPITPITISSTIQPTSMLFSL